MSEKIQKIIARDGYASRREAEKLIIAGRVRCNGKIVSIGDRASSVDVIAVDGKPLKNTLSQSVLLLYHKREGVLCTHDDPMGRETIYEQLPPCDHGKWLSVGRLDINSSGLLLVTNNGEWAHRLMHPSFHVEREYLVRIDAPLESSDLQSILGGVELSDGWARFKSIKELKKTDARGRNTWYKVVLEQGKNRIIRRVFEHVDRQVSRLIRVRVGRLRLPRNLAPGQYQSVSMDKVI